MTEFKLRDYQQECLQAIVDKYQQGVHRQLVSLPTGSGKTLVFVRLPKALSLSKRAMILAHREELIEQTANEAHLANPRARIGIERASSFADPQDHIVLASVPTIGRESSSRIKKFSPERFGLLITDECHHSISPTYQNVYSHFGLPKNCEILSVGFTATPNRGDGDGLDSAFDEVVYHKDIQEMIKAGWLCPIRGYRAISGTDISSVRTRMGDFQPKDLSLVVNTTKRNKFIVDSYLNICPQAKAIVFTVDVAHAHQLSEAFNKAGVACRALDGSMGSDIRHHILNQFREGEISVITNCMILSEGFNDPRIEAIIMARPTQSSLLYTQMIGRGTRTYPTKKHLIVIDIADNYSKHTLIQLPTLFGLPANFDLAGRDVSEVSEESVQAACGELESATLKLEEVKFFQDASLPDEVQKYSKLVWFRMPSGDYRISLADYEHGCISQDILGQWEITIEGTPIERKYKNLQRAFQTADSYIEETMKSQMGILLRNSPWRTDLATDKQIYWLRKHKISFVENITKGDAAIMLSKYWSK